MIELLLSLLLAHFAGDFALQPKKWVAHKEENHFKSLYLVYHIGVHLLLLLILTGFNFSYYIGYIVILTSHYLIDGAKGYFKNEGNAARMFLFDQALHVAVILMVVASYSDGGFTEIWNTIEFSWPFILLFVLALLLLTSVSSVVLKVLLSRWSKEISFESSQREAVSLSSSMSSSSAKSSGSSLDKAGMYIGVLERILVFTFILMNQWQAIGFLIAAKSVFRFSDLSNARDRKLTEYILLGTLLSFGIAILIGLLFSHFLRLL